MIKKEQYQNQKQKQKEGFTSFEKGAKEGFSTQICVPVTDESGVEEMEDVTVTQTFGSGVVEDAQTAFMHIMNALIIIVVFSVVSPFLMIHAIKQIESSYMFRCLLSLFYLGIIVAAISLLSAATSQSGGKNSRRKKQTKIFLGMYFLIVAFSIHMSITYAKISNVRFSDELDFSKYFDSGNTSLWDVFQLFNEPHYE